MKRSLHYWALTVAADSLISSAIVVAVGLALYSIIVITRGAKYCNEYACLSVCLSDARISRNPHGRTSCRLLVIYFRFCGWRHVFTQWASGAPHKRRHNCIDSNL